MEGFRFRFSYWVTFSLLWAVMASATAVMLYFLFSRCCCRRRVDPAQEDPFSGGPRGVDPQVIENFPIIKYSAAQGKKACRGMGVCVICLGVFKEDETLRLLPVCRHVFHSHCVDAWLKSHATCPCCRAPVVGSGSGLLKLLPSGLGRLEVPRGLEPSIVESCPKFSYLGPDTKVDAGVKMTGECVVCLGPFEENETLRLLPKCGHVFHAECVDIWLSSHATCPFCRAILLPAEDVPSGSTPAPVEVVIDGGRGGG
ncbi:hypothetical protein Cgig2_032043 [Carnegiea gigantea]|uniref:RING-type E3 ubiquitin transferase n=1 Tax=Carnegiea gigantea TaxID=171969 RepID=A0A9Q1QDK8_9CARY|nr:hypothetical protein Cgig2_032043 [Carnegiea gigantea]